jgi:hypothetical protein
MYTYGLLHQIALDTGVQPYLHGRSKVILKSAFINESLAIPILEETYCNTRCA